MKITTRDHEPLYTPRDVVITCQTQREFDIIATVLTTPPIRAVIEILGETNIMFANKATKFTITGEHIEQHLTVCKLLAKQPEIIEHVRNPSVERTVDISSL